MKDFSFFGRTPIVTYISLLLISPFTISAQSDIPGDFKPGDGVRVIAWQNPGAGSQNIDELNLSNDYLIDRTGQIFMPLIGYVRAVGLTRDGLAQILSERYKKFTKGVSFVCKPLLRLAVMGSVARPGSYLVKENATLWEVIDIAGGPVTGANLKKLYYTRGGRMVAKNLLGQFEQAYNIQEIGIQSGDQLVLPPHKKISLRTVIQVVSLGSSLLLLYLRLTEQ